MEPHHLKNCLSNLTAKLAAPLGRCLPLLLALAIVSPLTGKAALFTWTGLGDGTTYDLPTNWDPSGPPEAADDADFLLSSTYTVTFTDDEAINAAALRNGNLSMDLGGFTYTIFQVRVGGGAFVTVSNGTLVQTRNSDFSGVGMTSGGDAEMLLTGPNTHITAAYLRLGQQTRGVMRFEDGATGSFSSDANRFTIGRASGSHATLVITGVNSDDPETPKRSRVTTTGRLDVGSLTGSPRGAIFVEGGGELSTGGSLNLATANGQGIAVASGANSEITVGGNIAVSSGTAGALDSWLISRAGGHISSTGNINVREAGHVAGNSTIELLGVLNNGGLVAPGDPTLSYTNLSITRNYSAAIGSLTIDGDYVQQLVVGDDTFLGTLRIKVSSESAHDHLHITGDVTLAGILDLVDFGGANLLAGDELQILTWGGTLDGTFATIEAFELSEGLSWDFDRLYTDGIVSVIPEPGMLAFTFGLVAIGTSLVLRRRRS